MLEQYPISDLLTWMDERTLILNTEFQRRSVWPPQAKTYLIDTILRKKPIPNIYLRTKTDLHTRRNYREVVDGQQRLRAIHDFANGTFALGKNAGDFAGMHYEDLNPEDKAEFLSYRIGVEQLFNATDPEVLDVFHRINAYGLSLNPQELRHGKFQGAFRNAVVESSKSWTYLWESYRIVGVSERVRMADDELIAEMLGLILIGMQTGGQRLINKLYQDYDEALPDLAVKKLDRVVQTMLDNELILRETPLARRPHFLMLFAAVAHAKFGIPAGAIAPEEMPTSDKDALNDILTAQANLGTLSDIIGMEAQEVPERFDEFKRASAGTTQHIRSRKTRFLAFYRALLPEPI